MDPNPARDTFEIRRPSAAPPLHVTVLRGKVGAPAVYVLDAHYLLDVASGVLSMLRTLARLVDEPIPGFTLVGIGYPTDDRGQIFALRARDLTPTPGVKTSMVPLPPLEFGGAEEYLSTLLDQVVPAVEERYDVHARRRCLAGFSFGGLFGLYTLLHQPEAFSDYLVGSPSLWWDDGVAFAWEERWAEAHEDLNAHVFGRIGANEQLIGDSWKNERFPLTVLQRLAQVDRLDDMVKRRGSRATPS
jgi:predicted alpha/beta superfamily hydrolase